MMQVLYWPAYAVHVASGIMAFVVAPGALLTAKGGRWHRRWGKLYFWMMAAVALTGMIVGTIGPRANFFFVLLGIFTFYNCFNGYRVLFRKRPHTGQGPKMVDWVAALIALANGLVFITLGTLKPTPFWTQIAPVAIVFGGLCILIALGDIKDFLRPPTDKNFWWYNHMGGMIGSYIGAWTAFLIIGARSLTAGLPSWLPWLLPSAIGVPVITLWIAYYKHKFAQRAVSAAQ